MTCTKQSRREEVERALKKEEKKEKKERSEDKEEKEEKITRRRTGYFFRGV
jgi:hypothetical protein